MSHGYAVLSLDPDQAEAWHIGVGFCICSFNYEGQCEGLKLWNERNRTVPTLSIL